MALPLNCQQLSLTEWHSNESSPQDTLLMADQPCR